MEFNEEYQSKQELINNYLLKLLKIYEPPQIIVEAMKYSLLAGGKRIRPILSISICQALGGSIDEVLPYACSLEMIHTYSLIHDDLPSMDNDEYRRGKLTNHMVYGEGMAVLAGDALLNYAYEIMLRSIRDKKVSLKYINAAYEIAGASGIYGMIGGQVLDIENESKTIDETKLYEMHRMKTGALIKAACNIGCIIAEGKDVYHDVEDYGKHLGLAFQIVDDILDYTGDFSKLGKTTGKDLKNGKSTFVNIFGLESARELASSHTKAAYELSKEIDSSGFLSALTMYLLKREK